MTAQELSTVIRRGYTIERAILGKHAAYNDVAHWTYRDNPRAFGIEEDLCEYRRCETRSDLDAAMRDCADATSLTLIEITLEALDMPRATAAVGEFTRRYDYGVYGPAND